MKVAILDNGINTDAVCLPKLCVRYRVQVDGKFINNTHKEHKINHATICSAIVFEKNNDCSLYDIKVLDEHGKGNVLQLYRALQWCYLNEIDVIHMSLGTINYHDICKLDYIINKLLGKKTVIVAAHSNSRIRSFPATKKGVFGVQGIKIRQGSSTFISENSNLSIENSFLIPFKESIEIMDENIKLVQCNSFAAPILTKKILELCSAKNCDSEKIFDYFTTQCNRTQYPLKKYTTLKKKKGYEEHPVVFFSSELREECRLIYDKFKNNGYIVEGISYWEEMGFIPFTFFKETDPFIIDINLIYTIESIYNVNIVLFCLHEKNIIIEANVIDLKVTKSNNSFNMFYNDSVIIVNNIEEVYKKMLILFS